MARPIAFHGNSAHRLGFENTRGPPSNITAIRELKLHRNVRPRGTRLLSTQSLLGRRLYFIINGIIVTRSPNAALSIRPALNGRSVKLRRHYQGTIIVAAVKGFRDVNERSFSLTLSNFKEIRIFFYIYMYIERGKIKHKI